MDGAQKFVTDLNVARFVTFLEDERDEGKRKLWTNLLIAEENRFGGLSEQLLLAENLLEKTGARIDRQRQAVAGLATDHPAMGEAHRLLANMQDIQKIVQFRIENLKACISDIDFGCGNISAD